MKQFTIPAGMRDLILGECESKKQLQLKIENILDMWGYKEVITPSIEYFQTYNIGFENMKEEDMYKFFDANGRILMLRADMTIPIARVVATKFKDAKTPLRFRYCANVFKVHEELSGLYNEISDCGVELIGVDNDLEILVTAMEALKVIQDKKCILEIGNINIFNEACKDVNLNDDEKEKLAKLIDYKSLKSLKDYLNELNLNEKVKAFFLKLPWLSGDISVLEEAKKYAYNQGLLSIISNMQELCNQLNELGYQDISIDLGKVSNLNYYTGIIFEAFVEGVGGRVLSGGRYDTLISKYGRNVPAIGFSIKLDSLLEAYKPQVNSKKIMIEYNKKDMVEAIIKSKELRNDVIVELIENNELDEIIVREEK